MSSKTGIMLPAFPQFVAVIALIVTSGRYVESQAPEVTESCDAFCQQDSQCAEGCRRWTNMNPMVDSCEDACASKTGILASQAGDAAMTMVNYRRGCDYARNNYVRRVEGLTKKTVTDVDHNKERGSSWLNLQVDLPKDFNMSVNVQYATTTGLSFSGQTPWKYVPKFLTVSESGFYSITGLRSYTYYTFRLEVRATPESVFYSKKTVPVRTKEGGAPLDSPTIKKLEAISCHDIYLEFEPPKEPNGNIMFFEVRFKNDHFLSWKSESIDWDVRSHTLTKLSPGTTYDIEIRGINSHSMYGPWSKLVNVTTPYAPGNRRIHGKDPAALLWANHQEIRYIPDTWDFLNTRIVSEFTVYPFDHDYSRNNSAWEPLPNISETSPEAFQDFVYDARRKLAFVLTLGGDLLLIDFKEKSRRTLIQLASPGRILPVQKLSYDWLNMQIYFVRTLEQELWRCSVVNLDKIVPEKVGPLIREKDWQRHHLPSIRKVVVDPIDGYVFWLMSNGQYSSIYWSLMPSSKTSSAENEFEERIERILEVGFQINTFVVDFDTRRIIFPEATKVGDSTQRASLLAAAWFSPNGKLDLHTLGARKNYNLAKDLLIFEDSFYFFSSERLFRGHKVDSDYQIDEREANYQYGTGNVMAMQSYNWESQPLPYPMDAPRDIQVYVTTDSMLISWRPPQEQPFQSATAWNMWSYKVFVVSADSVYEKWFEVDNVTEARISTELIPNMTYAIQITAFKDEKTGPPSDPVYVRTYSAHVPKPEVFLTIGTFLINTTLQSPQESQFVRQDENLHFITDTVWGPDFVAVYETPKHLIVFPNTEMDMEVKHYEILDAVSLAYDWIGRKIYWSELINKKIKRATLQTPFIPEVILDGVAATHIVLDPLRGSMYFCSDFVLETARLNGQNRRALMSLVPTSSDFFHGVAIDSKQKLVYAVVQRQTAENEGYTEVYSRSLIPSFGEDGMLLLSTLPIFTKPKRSEIAVVDNRLLWKSGSRLAVTDLQFPYDTMRLYDRVSSFTRVNRFEEELNELNRTFADFRVIPKSVNESLIRMEEGGKNSIKFSWPVEECNYGRVQYDVIVTDTQGKPLFAERVSEPQVVIKDVSQEAHLRIIIQAMTEWASASFVEKRFVGQQLPRPVSWDGTSIALLVLGCLVVLLLIPVLFACSYLKERRKRLSRRASPDVDNRVTWDGVKSPFSDNAVYELRDLDISALPKLNRDLIVLGDFLGRGAFGAVHKGMSAGELAGIPPGIPLAVKQLRPGTDDSPTDFLKEACFMSQIQHPNILHFYGVCVEKEPFYIVMEYMNGGDLLSYLQSTCTLGYGYDEPVVSSLTLSDLLKMACDINQGCVYLEDTKKIHRDLAGRNCLVSCEEVDGHMRRTVKIADFGMSRDVYSKDYYRRGMRRGGPGVPVKWMAPECLTENIHTTQSDVWSFGVVLYELMAYGQKGPYHELSNDYVLEMQKRGGIHPLQVDKTVQVEPTVRNIMMQCWKMNRDERPTFRSILQVLESLIEAYCPKNENKIHGETEAIFVDEKVQPEVDDSNLSEPEKCRSYPTLRRKEYSPDSYHFYRSSPALLDQDSVGSNDSGVAITPKTVAKFIPPRSEFIMPVPTSLAVYKPRVHGSIPLDESGYLSYRPEISGPPPYLKILSSSEGGPDNQHVPVIKPQRVELLSTPTSFSLISSKTNLPTSGLDGQDADLTSMII